MNPRLGFLALALAMPAAAVKAGAAQNPRADFVSIQKAVPGIIVEMRYAGFHNFTGRPVTGYDAPKCLLTRQAARALAGVEADAKKRSLTLKVYDCYRPQKAVDDFIAWAKRLKDRTMKEEFYPHVAKKDLFRDGYIAARSAHSRGSTVDLTLVPLPAPKEAVYRKGEKLYPCTAPEGRRIGDNSIDMGTGF
ncbi:MAG: M15 family metallopeptidase, partial [Elusimicrobia bacterium]|nr:M15 family metallopeptidase [Elusimicrobiota bacterium]